MPVGIKINQLFKSIKNKQINPVIPANIEKTVSEFLWLFTQLRCSPISFMKYNLRFNRNKRWPLYVKNVKQNTINKTTKMLFCGKL